MIGLEQRLAAVELKNRKDQYKGWGGEALQNALGNCGILRGENAVAQRSQRDL